MIKLINFFPKLNLQENLYSSFSLFLPYVFSALKTHQTLNFSIKIFMIILIFLFHLDIIRINFSNLSLYYLNRYVKYISYQAIPFKFSTNLYILSFSILISHFLTYFIILCIFLKEIFIYLTPQNFTYY